jgi:hypothetical protein
MTHVVLSRRNLLALLAKLEIPGSECAIVKPGGIFISVESDEVHYAGRRPGPMEPTTEKFITTLDDVMAVMRERRTPVEG